MAQRLIESYRFQPDHYSLLNENESKIYKPSILRESLKYDYNQIVRLAENLGERLTERSDIDILQQVLRDLKENSKASGKFKVWKLPIGKYGNINGNKRIYPRPLWENVMLKQTDAWKNVCGLCDHPVADNDPGEFKNQACVWHDMDVGGDGIVFGLGSFVGPHGALAQEILEHGGRVGTSSSGFGDVDPITKVVDPNTYIIERLADLVLNPSQGTFGTAANSTSTAAEFLDDVSKGATIEFRNPIKENTRSKIMADKANAYNAAAAPAQTAPTAAPTGGAQQPAPTNGAQTGATPAQQQPVKESLQESTVEQPKNLLSKFEEKAFRKYVQTFLDDANAMANPIQRLNECVDILNCFDEGNCPDLRESLEKKLLEEKDALEKLVESVVKTEKDFDMDISSFREAAETITAQGILLNEQVADYKEICDGLAARNNQLNERVKLLERQLNSRTRVAEKKIMQSNQSVVEKSSEADKLKEQVENLTRKNDVLMERISKLNLTNKSFEKENGVLTTKLKEAAGIMKEVKVTNLRESKIKTSTEKTIEQLQEQIKEQDNVIRELENNYKVQSKRYDKLHEEFEQYREEVQKTYVPEVHFQPKASERIGKFLDLRENRGIEIEAYWSDLKEQYKENVDPFEEQIRGAKTLKEATNNFLKYRTQIDPKFAVGQPVEMNYRNRTERAQLYEMLGQPNIVNDYNSASIERKNQEFLDNLKASGLQ